MEIARFALLRVAAIVSGSDIGIPQVSPTYNTTQDILRVVFGIAGGIALIMVVIGGLKYINSLGNAQNVAKAKDTILYALIGLVVCVMAYSIVGFVIKKAAS